MMKLEKSQLKVAEVSTHTHTHGRGQCRYNTACRALTSLTCMYACMDICFGFCVCVCVCVCVREKR